MSAVRLEPEAKLELRQAARWYQRRDPGLVKRFLDELDTSIQAIAELPQRFPRVAGVDAPIEVRRCLLPTFPYVVVFVVTPNETVVLAIAHARREPGYWLYRIERDNEDGSQQGG